MKQMLITLNSSNFISNLQIIYIYIYISRHTIVCRVAQEVGAPHHEYINRKKENAIFTPMYLCDPLSNWNQICYRRAGQLWESTYSVLAVHSKINSFK